MGERKMRRNYELLEKISKYEENWNGYGAKPIPQPVLNLTKSLLVKLKYAPEISATGDQSMQLEYSYDDDRYLELEVFADTVKLFSVDLSGNESTRLIGLDVERICKAVEEFHEQYAE